MTPYITPILEAQQELMDEIKQNISMNQKGQFENDGGAICWYLDDLIQSITDIAKKRGLK